MVTKALLLLPGDRPELAVLPHQVYDGRPESHRGLELLAVHEEAAVAVDGDHAPARVHELGGDGGRQREPHAGQAVRDQDGSRLVRREHASDPELVQADVRDEDVVSAERLADLPRDARRAHRKTVVITAGVECSVDDFSQAARAAR